MPQTTPIVDSEKLGHGCKIIYAGFPSFFGVGLEDGHAPNFLASTVNPTVAFKPDNLGKKKQIMRAVLNELPWRVLVPLRQCWGYWVTVPKPEQPLNEAVD